MTQPYELVPRVADLQVGDMLVGIVDSLGDRILWESTLVVAGVSRDLRVVYLVGPGLKKYPYDWRVVAQWKGYFRLVAT